MITSKVDFFLLCLGFAGIAVCSYLLFFYAPKLDIQGGNRIGTIYPRGVIRRRVARSLSWENLVGSSTLYLRDIIYAPKESSAEVELEGGKKITLLPDSMIQLDEVTSDQISITLIDGQVKGQDANQVVVKKEAVFRMPAYPTRGAQSVMMAPPIASFELKHSELLGRVQEFLRPKENRIVPKKVSELRNPLSLSSLEYYVLKLLRPASNRYNLRANRSLEFAWTPIPLPRTRFVVELSRTPAFSSFLSHATSNTSVRLQIGEEGTYYWRVKLLCGGDERYSEQREFHMSLHSDLTKPVPILLPSSVPSGFAVEIARAESFSDEKFLRVERLLVVDSDWCPTAGLAKGGYYCRVRRVGDDKIIKEYSFVVH